MILELVSNRQEEELSSKNLLKVKDIFQGDFCSRVVHFIKSTNREEVQIQRTHGISYENT